MGTINILTLKVEELEAFSDILGDIQDRKVDGVIVKNFLTDSEVSSLLSGLAVVDSSKYIEFFEGVISLPKTFSMALDSIEGIDRMLNLL